MEAWTQRQTKSTIHPKTQRASWQSQKKYNKVTVSETGRYYTRTNIMHGRCKKSFAFIFLCYYFSKNPHYTLIAGGWWKGQKSVKIYIHNIALVGTYMKSPKHQIYLIHLKMGKKKKTHFSETHERSERVITQAAVSRWMMRLAMRNSQMQIRQVLHFIQQVQMIRSTHFQRGVRVSPTEALFAFSHH